MKLTPLTHEILANFSTINNGIVIEGGKTIKTLSTGRHIFAEANIDVDFPRKFAVHDLKQFLNVVDLFDNPDIKFEDKFMKITDQASSSRYMYSPEKHVEGYHPEKGYPTMKLGIPEIKFELSNENLAAMLRAGSVLQMPHIAIVGADGVQKLVVINALNPTSDTYERVVGTTAHTFNMVYTKDYWKFLPRTYQVSISTKGLARFQAQDVTYHIAAEASSTFEE